MPNHVANRVEFFGEQKNINEVMDKIKGEAEVIDFETIIPMPTNIYRGNLGQKEREVYGNNNWYDWCCAHWGTKWNAYSQEKNGNIIYFETAWCMPEPIYENLAEICTELKVQFEGKWCDENWLGGNCGIFESGEDGELYVDECETEAEMLEMCKDLWGYDPTEEEE